MCGLDREPLDLLAVEQGAVGIVERLAGGDGDSLLDDRADYPLDQRSGRHELGAGGSGQAGVVHS